MQTLRAFKQYIYLYTILCDSLIKQEQDSEIHSAGQMTLLPADRKVPWLGGYLDKETLT